MKLDWKQILQHAVIVALVALLGDILAHVPAPTGGSLALVVLALKELVNSVKVAA